MPKDHTNGSGTGATTQPTIHLILQGKGGVGKSVVASWLAEFLMGRGQPVRRRAAEFVCLGGPSGPAFLGGLHTQNADY